MKSVKEINRFIIIFLAIYLPFMFIDSYLVYKIPFLAQVVNYFYHILLQIVKHGAAFGLGIMGYDVHIGCLNPANCYNDIIWIAGSARSVQINHMCLALDILVMYFALIAGYPGHKKSKPWVILIGWILIIIVNMLRIMWLTVTMYQRPEAFDFEHHYVFKAITFTIIFIIWALWVKYFPADGDAPKKDSTTVVG